MTLFKNKFRIESARLTDYDYSQNGAYFITICTHNRLNLFGKLQNDTMELNTFGLIVNECWNNLPNHYSNIILDEFIIMPNHIHGILRIQTEQYLTTTGKYDTTKNHGLSEIVRALKSFSSRRINEMRKTNIPNIWQPRFYDRVIRNERELHIIRNYIRTNPVDWEKDELCQNSEDKSA